MKQILILSLILSLLSGRVTAQTVLDIDAANTVGDFNDYYLTMLGSEGYYANDGGYYVSLLQNPFYEQTLSDTEWAAVEVHQMGNKTPVVGNYFGIATWATTAQFDNVTVKDKDGNELFSDDFTKWKTEWNQNGGAWSISDGMMHQTDEGNLGSINACYRYLPVEGSLELDATKLSGAEGFLIALSYLDENNYIWWNIGGWNNTGNAIEQCIDGQKNLLMRVAGSITTGHTYHLKMVMQQGTCQCFMDDELIHTVPLTDLHKVYATAALNPTADHLTLRITNPSSVQQKLLVRLANADIAEANLTHTQSSTAFTEEYLRTRTSWTTSQTRLTPVDGYAFAFDARARSLNTIDVTTSIPTAIEEVNGQSGNGQSVNGQSVNGQSVNIYDLSGRQLSSRFTLHSSLPRGLYIVNGRKVLIR